MSRAVSVGSRAIGDGHPCFIIAEAGSNHNGRLVQARRLIEVAARAGADAVKFQFFRASRLYPKEAGRSDYLKDPRPIYEIVSKLEVPYDWIPRLAQICQEQGVLFMASVFDEESADRVDPHVQIHKIASYEMTHWPLVRHVARKGKPVIVSTGTADLEEVAQMADDFRSTGNPNLALMQCTASYPAPLESLNVRAIATLKRTFGVPAGLSDHSRDPLLGPMAAVAAGANLVEKHFTLSNRLPGPDHRFAVEPRELRQMVEGIRRVEQALGNGVKRMHPVEEELHRFARRSIFALSDIAEGEPLGVHNVAVLRCGKIPAQLAPREFPSLLGRRAARSIPSGCAIRREDLT